MCKCGHRGLTACLVCCGLFFAPLGAKNPPTAAVGHVLTTVASSTASTSSAQPVYSVPNAVTGVLHRLPVKLHRPAVLQPDKDLYS
jgi:hypothetical protein